jgi:HK97 family phage portal protein
MGILERLGLITRAELEALKASLPKYEKWMLQTADAESYQMPDPSVYGNQADLYRTLSWVLLAVDITAASAALVPLSVKRRIGDKEPKDITNHPFELLIEHPNPLDSRYEFLYSTVAFYKLNGNAYWWMNCKDENTPPDEMWVIPPEKIIPVPDGNMYLRGYMYYPGNGAEIFLEPHQIVHLKRFNPASTFIGLSAIEAIALVAAGDLGMQKYNTTLFANNNGRLPSVMTFEQMVADPTWEKIKNDTREAAKNREMLMLRGVGQGGVNWLQNSISQREMEFLDGRKFNKEEIMSVVAPGSYTMLSENATQANSVVGRATFNELNVYPMLTMMGEKITNSILPRYAQRLIALFDDIRVTDKDLKLREQDAFERSHTIGEVRQEIYGDEPLGDERDNLLLSELGRASIPDEPPALPAILNAQPDEVMPELPETQPNDSEANKAMKDDLARYQRKALRSVGKPVTFDSDNIPEYVREQIEKQLPACKSDEDVKSVFKGVRVLDESRIHVTVEAIKQALNFKVK